MGYRSDVAYMVCFKNEEVDGVNLGRDMFYTFLAEAKSKTETAKCFLENIGWGLGYGFKVDEENMRISFSADNVKWYEGYEDVDCHDALVNMAGEYCDADETRVEGINSKLRKEKDEKYGHLSYEDMEKQGIPQPNYVNLVVGYSYVRLGEEDDDNDCRWSGWEEAIERCRMTRAIDFNDY